MRTHTHTHTHIHTHIHMYGIVWSASVNPQCCASHSLHSPCVYSQTRALAADLSRWHGAPYTHTYTHDTAGMATAVYTCLVRRELQETGRKCVCVCVCVSQQPTPTSVPQVGSGIRTPHRQHTRHKECCRLQHTSESTDNTHESMQACRQGHARACLLWFLPTLHRMSAFPSAGTY